VEFSLALLLAAYLLYKYGNFRKHNPFVTGCTLLVWFLSFVIIFLLPVDVSSVSGNLFVHLKKRRITVDNRIHLQFKAALSDN